MDLFKDIKKRKKTEITSIRFDKDGKNFMRKMGIKPVEVFEFGMKQLKRRKKKK